MMVQHLKRRPLSRYLKDFKHSQTHCAHCRKLLDRITLVRDGKIVNKIEISRLDALLDENGWQTEQKSWAALCRFCGDLHCKTQSDFFDIIGFKQFLFEQTEMSPGTVREYVVRLRRLGNHLHEQNISLDPLQDGFLDEILAPWLPTTSTRCSGVVFVFTNNGSTLQTDITTFGVNMKLAHLGRQALMGVMAVALVAGMSVKSFADEGLLNKVKERGTLLVGLEGTYPPFSFQGDDGKLTGFEVEFAQQLAKHLGVEASLKPTKWDGMLASLDSKRIDVVINQVTISDERKKKYDFSTPYTISGIQALVKKGNEGTIKTAADLKGKKVGVGLGTNYEEWLRQNVQGVDVRTYDDDPTKYQDLRVGRIDAILVDRLAALDLVKKTNDTLAVTGEAFSRQESGVALRKGNEDLLKAVNDAIAEMQKDGTLQALSEKWFGADVTK